MKPILRNTLIVIASLLVAGALFFSGMMFGGLFGFGRMALAPDASSYGNNGSGPNQGNGYGPGMMGGYGNNPNNPDPGYGPGMMGGNGGMMGGNGGMMGGNGYQSNVKPVSIEQAKQAVEKYLLTLNNADLKIDEIMVFSNNAYARIVEKSTNIGAFEVLVDPSSLDVFPEYGPNMMWNLKYGGLNHQSMMGGTGGMMNQSWTGGTPAAVSAEMPIKVEQALKAAQDYLDVYFKGAIAAEKADPFYGYYTIDILRDGKITGMLGVNGYNGQVIFHSWHGDFIEMSEQ